MDFTQEHAAAHEPAPTFATPPLTTCSTSAEKYLVVHGLQPTSDLSHTSTAALCPSQQGTRKRPNMQLWCREAHTAAATAAAAAQMASIA